METHFQALNEECGPFGGYFPAFFATTTECYENPFFNKLHKMSKQAFIAFEINENLN